MNLYLYIENDSPLHRLDPRAKLLFLIGMLLFSIAAEHPLLPGLLFLMVLACCHLAGAWRSLRRVRALLIILSGFSLVTWSLFASGSTHLFGPVSLESVLYGLGTGLKLSCAVAGATVFLSATKNEEIAAGLIRMGLPYNAAFAFSMALRLVPTFVGAGATIVQAQKSRGLDVESGSLLQRMRKYMPLVVPVFASAIRSTNHLAMALESKGFGAHSRRTNYLQLRMGMRDWLVVLAAALMFVGFLAVRFLGYGMIPGLLK